MNAETHWGIRYTNLETGRTSVTDYEADEHDARRDMGGQKTRTQNGCHQELVCRSVTYGDWISDD